MWSEFESCDSSHWIQQATQELKGTNTLQTFTWLTEEGISWQPAYHPEPAPNLKTDWIQIAQLHRQSKKPQAMLRLAWHPNVMTEIQEALHRGILGIQLCMPTELPEAIAIQKSLHQFPWADIPLYWMTNQPAMLYQRIKSFHPYPLKGGIPGIQTDSEGETWCRAWYSGVSIANSGANAVHELAYILHSWQANPGITTLEFSLQTNFFLDVAKGRALRYLAHRLATQDKLAMPCLMASFNPYYYTRQSSATNQLRVTTAAMAAILGGVDGYWLPAWTPQQRMALNIPLILEAEGYLDQVVDPSHGSYFLEAITRELIEAVAAFLDSIPSDFTLADWQTIADTDHHNRLKRNPIVVGATHYKSPEAIVPPFSILTWPSIFPPKSLEEDLVGDLPDS